MNQQRNRPPGMILPLLFGVCVLFLTFSSLLEAQVVTDDGTPISPETPQLREKLRFQKSDNAEDWTWSHEFSYGLSPTWELRAELPIHHRDIQFEDESGTEQSTTLTGFGDLSLRFQQSLDQTDWVMGSNRLALNVGLEAPTGDSDETGGGSEIPRRLQLGQGDWSSSVGATYTRVEDRTRYSVEGNFTHHTRHDGVRRGEELNLNLAYWYRMSPAQFKPSTDQTEIRGVFELLSTYRFSSRENGDKLNDDGLNVWASPGLQTYLSPKVQLESAVQVPLTQGIDDSLGDRDYAVQLNVKILF